MKKGKIILFIVVLMFSIVNIVSTVKMTSSVNELLSLDYVESLASTESSYKNARNQYCKNPKGAVGCVDDVQGRTCTYTIFCIE